MGESVSELVFRILGSIELDGGRGPVSLTAPRQEVVLAMLLLEAGQSVPVDRLIEAVWEETPPSTARSQVQICISQLRKLLAQLNIDATIRTSRTGYRLTFPAGLLDLELFRESVTRAAGMQQPDESVVEYRAALELWRGDACAGVESRVVGQAVTRLHESRLAALGDCIDLELRLGRHHQVIGELSELVSRYPLWERARGQLMLALHRSGRSAEALEVFRAGRAVLIDELGLEPGKTLQVLHQAILNNDSGLDAGPGADEAVPLPPPAQENAPPDVVPQLLPSTIADFSGRHEELDSIVASLHGAGGGSTPSGALHVPIVVLTGRGGVGKTTLAIRAAHLLNERFPDGRLYARLGEAQGPASSVTAVLDRFLRSFGMNSTEIPDNAVERAETYRSKLAGRRVLVVLDDVSSARQISDLLPGEPGCAVIMTSRSRLAGPPGAAWCDVGPLDTPAGASLVTGAIGSHRASAEPEAITSLVELCEGLPLALRIVTTKLATRPHWRVVHLVERLSNERLRLDELALEGASIRATLDFTYRGLAEDQQRLLRRLSILGAADFAGWISAVLLDDDVRRAESLLESLVEEGLVQAWSTHAGNLRYQLHDMVRLYAGEQLARSESAATRREILSRYLGGWLSLAAEAHRRHYGGDFYVLHGTAAHWPLPKERVQALLTDPVTWFQSERTLLVEAILLAARGGFDEICWDLAITSDTLFESGPYPEDWQVTHLGALEVTRRAGNDRGTAALLYSLGVLATTRQLDEAEQLFGEALVLWEKIGDRHGSALTTHGLAGVERLRGSYDAASVLYGQALVLMREVGDQAGESAVLRCMGQIAMDRRQYRLAEERFERAAAVAQRVDSKRDSAQAQYHLAELCLQLGDLTRAEGLLKDVCRESRLGADSVGEGFGYLSLGITYAQMDATEKARESLRTATELSQRAGDVLLNSRVLLASAEVEFAAGDLDSAATRAMDACAAFQALGSHLVWRARCLELAGRALHGLGRTDEAVRMWREAAESLASKDAGLSARLAAHLKGAHAASAAHGPDRNASV
ncbi:BTAD domain-containing putative transcriptional regulator [Streptomyces sp. NPDC006602]|uniref:AfsR/SARP family transcriptional regulator n=1 Tax=Streptomyces sp. NPDC006602 TaxID=3364751 RepID=UPI0036B86D27